MPSVFQKLNLKNHTAMVVIQPPASFEAELAALPDVTIHRTWEAVTTVSFGLVLATQQQQVDNAAAQVARLAHGDAVVWLAYPKGSSKNYRCDFNRDTGWAKLGEAGFEAVRQVAVDADWSALRFRRVEFIRSLRRDPQRALSASGKARTTPR